MYTYLITLSLALLCHTISLSMDKKEPFYFAKLPIAIQKNVFALAHPCIKNQLKNTCKSVHNFGARYAPHFYEITNYDLNITDKDRTFMMFNAAHDKNLIVIEQILDHTDQRIFEYSFVSPVESNKGDRLVVVSVLDMPFIWSFRPYYWEGKPDKTPEKIKSGIMRGLKSETWRGPSALQISCYLGRHDEVRQEARKTRRRIVGVYQGRDWKMATRDVRRAFIVSIQNDDDICIAILAPYIPREQIEWPDAQRKLLTLAMKYNHKKAFNALVENNIYCSKNTKMLTKLSQQKDIPNLDEYTALYKRYTEPSLLYEIDSTLNQNPDNNCCCVIS